MVSYFFAIFNSKFKAFINPIKYSMKKQVALGIDIGGTNTAFGFIDKEGNYMAEGNISTNNHEDINDYLKELHMEIEKVLDTIRNEVELTGIGIGAPCGNYLQGTIEHASNQIGSASCRERV